MLVTANYKLSFDSLRRSLQGIDAWLLVVDTRGINVWCAAGKGTFSADEIGLQAHRAGLERIVTHRELILPQLAAPGVSSRDLKRLCGFKGFFGPIHAHDIAEYLLRDKKADERMRSVSFGFGERVVLTPVELVLTWKIILLVSLISVMISGIVPGGYSIEVAWIRGLKAIGATVAALVAGAVVTPALLPWIPGRQFWFKGALTGFIIGLLYHVQVMMGSHGLEQAGILLWIAAASSYMAMNFTGATPFTSLSGVEQEMRKGLLFQLSGTAVSIGLWISAPFVM